MKDFDLESEIRKLHVPNRDADYWNDFPHQVLAHVRTQRASAAPQRTFFEQFGGSISFALGCLVACLCLWQAEVPRAVLREEKQVRQSLVRLEKNLTRAMRNEHGLHYLIEEPQ